MLKFAKGKVLGTLPGVLTFFFLLAGIFAFNRVNVDVRNFHLVRDGLIERAAFPVRGDFAIGEPFSVEFDLVSSSDEVLARYREYAEMLKALIPQGCSAAVYTQTTDVEGEVAKQGRHRRV